MRHDLHWLDVTDRTQFRIAVAVYRCLHGTAPQYLSELLVPASTRSLVTVSDPLTATSWSCRLSNGLHMDDVLLVYQDQLFGTACRIISESPHYSLIRLGAISKPTFLHVSLETVTVCTIQVFIVIV